MIIRKTCGLVAATAALVVLAGCSGTTAAPAPEAGTSATPASSTAYAAADVAFVQGMIPHHEQAVAMADLTPTRAASPELRELASRIRAGQGPEIDRMTGLLTAWGAPRPAPGSMAGMGGMSGMMSPDQMRGLETATGAAFDRAFLEMMVAHHTGAVEMARTELAQGRSPEARGLAQEILDAQQAEIAQMQVLRGRV